MQDDDGDEDPARAIVDDGEPAVSTASPEQPAVREDVRVLQQRDCGDPCAQNGELDIAHPERLARRCMLEDVLEEDGREGGAERSGEEGADTDQHVLLVSRLVLVKAFVEKPTREWGEGLRGTRRQSA